METVGDPALEDWFVRTRSAFGVRIVSLREAPRLSAALKRGEHVGLVADRDITGGGVEVPSSRAPAPVPVEPAFHGNRVARSSRWPASGEPVG